MFSESKEVYEKKGQHDYPYMDLERPIVMKRDTMSDGSQTIYFGQTQSNGKPDGVGIGVTSWGSIYEGCWKDGYPNGFTVINYDLHNEISSKDFK